MKRLVYIVVGALATVLVVAMVAAASIWPVLNEVETGVTAQYPEVQPHYYSTSPERIFVEARAALEGLERWEHLRSEPADYVIEAERKGRLFASDVTVRVEPVTEFVSQVHVKSSSRMGRSDFGQNARNIQEFLAELDERLGAVKFVPGTDDEEAGAEDEGAEEEALEGGAE